MGISLRIIDEQFGKAKLEKIIITENIQTVHGNKIEFWTKMATHVRRGRAHHIYMQEISNVR